MPAKITELLKAAMKNAYAPYSKFTVGAVVLTESGEIFSGCNVENASYGATLCAERVAIFSAVAAGHRKFQRLALISKNAEPITPCGLCRQVMAEFFSPSTEIYCHSGKGDGFKKYLMKDLLPEAFSSQSLKS